MGEFHPKPSAKPLMQLASRASLGSASDINDLRFCMRSVSRRDSGVGFIIQFQCVLLSPTVLADVSSAYRRSAGAKAIFCRFTLASLPGYAAPQPPLWLPARLA